MRRQDEWRSEKNLISIQFLAYGSFSVSSSYNDYRVSRKPIGDTPITHKYIYLQLCIFWIPDTTGLLHPNSSIPAYVYLETQFQNIETYMQCVYVQICLRVSYTFSSSSSNICMYFRFPHTNKPEKAKGKVLSNTVCLFRVSCICSVVLGLQQLNWMRLFPFLNITRNRKYRLHNMHSVLGSIFLWYATDEHRFLSSVFISYKIQMDVRSLALSKWYVWVSGELPDILFSHT